MTPDDRDRVSTPVRTDGGVGTDAARPDGTLKVTGEFAYGSDLWADEHGLGRHAAQPAPVRADPVDRHRRRRWPCPACYAVLTADDVPGASVYGLEFRPAGARDGRRALPGRAGRAGRGRPPGDRAAGRRADRRRLRGARAGHRRRGSRSGTRVRAEVHPEPTPVVERSREAAPLHPHGNLIRHLKIRKGDPDADAPTSSSSGDYEVGMQDQAFLGPESGLAVPGRGRRRRPLRRRPSGCTSTSSRSAAPSACRPEKVRLTLAGVGGAFGGREDLSMHVHACLLAMHTGKPVKMSYNREESFFGHVHRHPARAALRARRSPATATWSTSAPRSGSTAGRTRPAARPSSATPG